MKVASSMCKMKAIHVHQFVDIWGQDEKTAEANLTMTDHAPKPTSLEKKQLLVKVLACSIAPGDVIMVQGNMKMMHRPFPFVPGMAISGVIVDNNQSTEFKNGDKIVASNGMSPVGGLAEYMAVSEDEAVLKPENISNEEGAAGSDSAVTARNAVMDYVKEGDRVMILGGSGGVGSAAISIAKRQAKASLVVTTSTQSQMCRDLGADRVINYQIEDWWKIEEYARDKFDVIIDTVGGGNFYGRAPNVLKTGKQGGRFIAVALDDSKPDCSTVWKQIKFFATLPAKPLYTMMKSGTYPKYVLLFPYDEAKGRKEVMGWMEEGSLKIKLDDKSPLPFTAEGVRSAFLKVGSGHAHGKVVVEIAKE